jgi:DNA-binding MarR family transcriptional regulator
MRIRKGLFLTILAALIVGSTVAALTNVAPKAQSTATGPRPATLDDPAMTIPLGRIGDKVVYARFEQRDGNWTPIGNEVFELGGLQEIRDAEGVPRKVLAIRSNALDKNGTRANGMWRAPQPPGDVSVMTEFIDLGSRQAIRIELEGKSAKGGPQGALGVFTDLDSALEGLELQGRTLKPLEDVSDTQPSELAPHVVMDVGAQSVTGVSGLPTGTVANGYWTSFIIIENAPGGLVTTARVDQVGTLDGVPSVAITVDTRFPAPARGNAVFHFPWYRWTRDIEGGSAHVRRTIWLDGTAYPRYEEIELRGISAAGKEMLLARFARHRISVSEGAMPIPWESPSAETPRVVAPRSGPVLPTDGPDPGVAYPLGQALADVENDPRLANYYVWKIQNPDAILVSALHLHGQNHPTTGATMWRFIFAKPDGKSYEVQTERVPGQPPIVRDPGERYGVVARVTAADFPQNPPSLTEMNRLWREQAPESVRGLKPDYVQWGLRAGLGNVISAANPAPCSLGFAYTTGRSSDLEAMEFGITTMGPCMLPDAKARQAALVVDARMHRTLGDYDRTIDYNVDEMEADGQASLPSMDPGPSGGMPLPRLGAAAVASGSFLAVFLVAYFWPTLKYAGTQAAMVLPGYSKIAKSALLDSPVRDQLVTAIRQEPGVHASDLGRRVQVGWGNLVYHLDRLEDEGLVFSTIDGRHRRFFVAGEVAWTAREQLALLKNARARELYEIIFEHPDVPQHELAKFAGVSASNATRNLRKLEQAGLIERRTQGRAVQYRVPAGAKPYDADAAVEVT